MASLRGAESVPVEVAIAEAEVRLRNLVTDALREPTQRTSTLQAELMHLRTLVSQQTQLMHSIQEERYNAIEKVNSVEAIREDMKRWDSARMKHDQTIEDKLASMQQKLDGFSVAADTKETLYLEMRRLIDRSGLDIAHVSETSEGNSKALEGRIDRLSNEMAKSMTTIDLRIKAADAAHKALVDELWGEELSLAQLGNELGKVRASVTKLGDAIEVLHGGKATLEDVDRLRTDMEEAMQQTKELANTLNCATDEVITEVKEHFKTAMDTAASHNSAVLRTVQKEHKAEMAKCHELRTEVAEFMAEMERRSAELEERVKEQSALVSELGAERRGEMEELSLQRRRDRCAAQTDIKTIDQRVKGALQQVEKIGEVVHHLQSVQDLMLESELIQASIDNQDVRDREQIALFGIKDDEAALARTTLTEPQKPRPEARVKVGTSGRPTPATSIADEERRQQQAEPGQAGARSVPGAPSPSPRRQAPGGAGNMLKRGDGQGAIVRVDDRCIACSGQSPFVLAAFKMACLHYSPSPVDHCGKQCSRHTLLEERQELLEEARRAMDGGSNANAGMPRRFLRTPSTKSPSPDLLTRPVSGGEDAAKSRPPTSRDAFAFYASLGVAGANESPGEPQRHNAPGSPGTATTRLPQLSTSVITSGPPAPVAQGTEGGSMTARCETAR